MSIAVHRPNTSRNIARRCRSGTSTVENRETAGWLIEIAQVQWVPANNNILRRLPKLTLSTTSRLDQPRKASAQPKAGSARCLRSDWHCLSQAISAVKRTAPQDTLRVYLRECRLRAFQPPASTGGVSAFSVITSSSGQIAFSRDPVASGR